MKEIFVVTDPELGWDCVVGVYTTLEGAIKCVLSRMDIDVDSWKDYETDYGDLDGAVIHEELLRTKF